AQNTQDAVRVLRAFGQLLARSHGCAIVDFRHETRARRDFVFHLFAALIANVERVAFNVHLALHLGLEFFLTVRAVRQRVALLDFLLVFDDDGPAGGHGVLFVEDFAVDDRRDANAFALAQAYHAADVGNDRFTLRLLARFK